MLFKKPTNRQAFLKMGLLGFGGDGKSTTASLVAVGLVQLLRERGLPAGDRPVMFLDSEPGSDWVRPIFDRAGVELWVHKSRAFVDMKASVQEAEQHGSVLIVDSVTHFWRGLCDEYARRNNRRNGLEAGDWNWLKGQWAEFTELFANSRLHIILCGRAGYEYEHVEGDDGRRTLQKVGVKMRAEGETEFEPALVARMERHEGPAREGSTEPEVWHTATVTKDRSAMIHGRTFRNPTFRDFLAHIECLDLGGTHDGVNMLRDNSALFTDRGTPKWLRDAREKSVVLDEIQTILNKHVGGQSADAKAQRISWLEKAFNTPAWGRVETMDLDLLVWGRDFLWQQLERKAYTFAPLDHSPKAGQEPRLLQPSEAHDEDVPY